MSRVEKRVVRAALRAADTALTDWVRSYAPEMCYSKYLKESRSRVYEAGGTLAYISGVRQKIVSALNVMDRAALTRRRRKDGGK